MARLVFIFVAVLCGVFGCAQASNCQDYIVANLKVSAEEAKSLCSACIAVQPSSQCTACFRAAKTLLAAAKCPTTPLIARELPQLLNVTVVDKLEEEGGGGATAMGGITIIFGK